MKRIFKFIFTVVLIACLSISFVGCADEGVTLLEKENHSTATTKTITVSSDNVGLEEVYSYRDISYFRERCTNVMYVWKKGEEFYGTAGMSVMFDAETGKPLTYDKFVVMLEELPSTKKE